MGPQEIALAGEIIDNLIRGLAALPDGTALTYNRPETAQLRTQLAELRMHAGQLLVGFPDAHFPIASPGRSWSIRRR